MEKNEKKKPKSSLKKTVLALFLGGALLASPVLLSGCETDAEVKNGVNGKTWHAGSYNPREVEDFGENGDFYLDEDDFLVYKKEVGEWLLLGKIQGEDAISVDDTTYVYYVDADSNVYVDITTHYSNDTHKTTRVYPGSKINVGKVMTLEKALEVAPVGATIALTQDVELDEGVVANKKAIIDFAGHSISNTEKLTEGSIFTVAEGANVTFVDSSENGSMQSMDVQEILGGGIFVRYGNCSAVTVAGDAKCAVESGTFVGEKSAIHVEEGSLKIEGGSFQVKDVESRKNTLTCADDVNIAVSGGEFVGFNPARAGDEGKNFMAEGSTVISMKHPVSGVEYFGSFDKDEAIDMLEELPDGENATITLSEDMVLTKPMIINKHLTIDLNGYKISNEVDFWEFEGQKICSIFQIEQYGLLTINDSSADKSGSIVAKENDAYVANLVGGDMIVNGGTISGNITAIQVNMGTLTINGGEFLIQQLADNVDDNKERYTINCIDANYKNGAYVIINGGKFRRYNPADNLSEGEGTNHVGAGYGIYYEDGYFCVKSQSEIFAGVAKGEITAATVTLGEDLVLEQALELVNTQFMIDLNGYTISNTTDFWNTTDKIYAMFNIYKDSALMINDSVGTGSIVAKENDCFVANILGGEMVVNGGTINGNVSAIQVNMGTLTINGGTFLVQQKASNVETQTERYTINCIDANYNKGAFVEINGGKFINFDPANNLSEGPATDYVPSGYVVESNIVDENTTEYTVVKA